MAVAETHRLAPVLPRDGRSVRARRGRLARLGGGQKNAWLCDGGRAVAQRADSRLTEANALDLAAAPHLA